MKIKRLLTALGAVGLLAALILTMPLITLAQTEDPCEDLAPAGADPPYYVGLGDAYFALGNYTRAIVIYTCAIDLDPDYALAYVNRGFAHAVQHNDPPAMADYNRALELNEGLVEAYNNRGLLYTNQGNFGLAIADFTVALALAPDYAIAYNNRGVVHAIEGNHDLALVDFQEAVALDPEYAAPHASLGALYSALAAQSYRDYFGIVGEGRIPPAGDPDTVLNALSETLITGNFSVWLPLLTPAQ